MTARRRSHWSGAKPVLEGAAYVGFHVTFFGAGRHHRGGNRVAAWSGQHDARRFAQPVAKAHAAARATAIRRHHRNHGDNLGDGSLGQERSRALTSSEQRAYIQPSPSSWPVFSSWRRSSRWWRPWPSANRQPRTPGPARRPAAQGMRRQRQLKEYA